MTQDAPIPEPLFTETAPVGTIKIDHSYQRPFSEAWVRQFFPFNGRPPRKVFDPRAILVPPVSLRDDGLYAMDGQHRIRLVERMYGPDHQITVAVYSDLTVAQEAALCLLFNTDRAQTPADKYRIALAAGEERATAMKYVLERYGFAALGDNNYPAGSVVIKGTATLMEIMNDGGVEQFQRVAHVIYTAWKEDVATANYIVWWGIYGVFAHYHPERDFDARLIERLRAKTPDYFLRLARNTAATGSRSLSITFAQEVVKHYNSRKQGPTRLPNWNDVDGRSAPRPWMKKPEGESK